MYFNLVRGAGLYSDGWRDDGSSQAIYDTYARHAPRLGTSADKYDGGIWVHEVPYASRSDFVLQDFVNTGAQPYGTDGWTAIIYNPTQRLGHLIREGFWGTYKCLRHEGHGMGGATLLGAPENEEAVLPNGKTHQDFEFGYMEWNLELRTISVDFKEHRNLDPDVGSGCIDVPVIHNPPLLLCPCIDGDGDGFVPSCCTNPALAALALDCDDSTFWASPGNPEHCDGIDSNCRDGVDEGCDGDGDGYCRIGASVRVGATCVAGDCNDDNASVKPGAPEMCGNGIDENCDGPDAACACPDRDGDGHRDQTCGGDDCMDHLPTVYPGRVETCDDHDNNCNGVSDEGCDCLDGLWQPCGTDEGECIAGEERCIDGGIVLGEHAIEDVAAEFIETISIAYLAGMLAAKG